MDYSKYPSNWKTVIRPAIIKRDKHRCKHCGKVQNQLYIDFNTGKYIRTVLHVAHLDHDPYNNNVKSNRLRTLCAACHLEYDRNSGIHNINVSKRKPKKKDRKKINKIKNKHPFEYYFGLSRQEYTEMIKNVDQ